MHTEEYEDLDGEANVIIIISSDVKQCEMQDEKGDKSITYIYTCVCLVCSHACIAGNFHFLIAQ